MKTKMKMKMKTGGTPRDLGFVGPSWAVRAMLSSRIIVRDCGALHVAVWLPRLSPYYYADATKTLATGRAAWGDMLVAVAAAFLAGAVAVFRRKDIAA